MSDPVQFCHCVSDANDPQVTCDMFPPLCRKCGLQIAMSNEIEDNRIIKALEAVGAFDETVQQRAITKKDLEELRVKLRIGPGAGNVKAIEKLDFPKET